jgi:hypothetical protein
MLKSQSPTRLTDHILCTLSPASATLSKVPTKFPFADQNLPRAGTLFGQTRSAYFAIAPSRLSPPSSSQLLRPFVAHDTSPALRYIPVTPPITSLLR